MSRMSKIHKTILIVEDEAPLQSAIQTKLQHHGFDTVCVNSIQDAIRMLDSHSIHAVWLDHYLLGKEDGLTLVSHMKAADSTWRHIPIFVVSNTASEKKVQAYMQLGVDKYFVKAEHQLEEIISNITAALAVS